MGVPWGAVEKGPLELDCLKNSLQNSKPGAKLRCAVVTPSVGGWAQEIRAKLWRWPLPNCLPGLSSPGVPPQSHTGTQTREGRKPFPWWGWRGPAVRGAGSTGPAPAPPLPAPPIGPESGDSRAEQEGNRSPSERASERAAASSPGRAATATAARPLVLHRQHERPARLQHVSHRVP